MSCEVSKDISTISVEMGQVSFRSDIIPVSIAGDPREVLEENIILSDTNFSYYGATIGNPHCVIPVDELTNPWLRNMGLNWKTIQTSPTVQMYNSSKILDRNRIKIEIWERGAGYTLASGSSSSAAGAVARKMGACDEDITVEMPGGEIQLHIDDQFNVLMKGPLTRVGQMSSTTNVCPVLIICSSIYQVGHKIELAKDTRNWFFKRFPKNHESHYPYPRQSVRR